MKVDKRSNTYIGILETIKQWILFLPLVGSLKSPSMRERHWEDLRAKTKADIDFNAGLQLRYFYDLNLVKIAEDVEEITDQAGQEARMESQLQTISAFWKDVKFDFYQYKDTDVQMLRLTEENFE